MIRETKKQAKGILVANYTLFVFPVVLYMLSNGLMAGAYYAYSHKETIFQNPSLWGTAFLLLYMAFQFVVMPTSVFLFYKIAVGLVNGEAADKKKMRPLVSLGEIGCLSLLWLLPSALNIVSAMSTEMLGEQPLSETVSLWIRLLLSLFSIYVQYKYFACNYHFSLFKGNMAENLRFSFELMRRKFGQYLLLIFSFILWYLLIGVLGVVLTNLFNGNELAQILLRSTGCGVYFYVLPYQYITYTLFIKNTVKQQGKR